MVDDVALEAGKKLDMQACALVLAEAFACGLSPNPSSGAGGPPEAAAGWGNSAASGGASGSEEGPGRAAARLDQAALRRLLFDVFHEDISQFRDYCLQARGGGGRVC